MKTCHEFESFIVVLFHPHFVISVLCISICKVFVRYICETYVMCVLHPFVSFQRIILAWDGLTAFLKGECLMVLPPHTHTLHTYYMYVESLCTKSVCIDVAHVPSSINLTSYCSDLVTLQYTLNDKKYSQHMYAQRAIASSGVLLSCSFAYAQLH